MTTENYNLVAIGGGAAGLVSSYIAATVKAKVALIERHKMGGDCLNTGCVPSKALIQSAKVVSTLRKHKSYGLEDVSFTVNFAEMMEHVQKIIRKIEPHDSIERYTALGVKCYTGNAKICSPNEVKVDGKRLKTKNIIIATGARPFIPPIPGLETIDYLHSDNLWEIRELPKHLLVIGGGPIGCELAQAFRRIGAEVSLMDMAPSILPREDPDISQYVKDVFLKEGTTLYNSVQIKKFTARDESKKSATVHFVHEGKKQTLDVDAVLVAAGRKANTTGFGLEELGVQLNPNGTVKVDSFLHTNIQNIYACGDVAGPYQFTHMAGHQAWYATVNALFAPFKKFPVDYSVVPWCTYTDPEIAQVGLNETEAKAQNIPHEITTYSLGELDRAITDRTDYGLIKVITPPGKDRILGATICGVHAGDLLAEYVLAMKHGLGLNKILGTIHSYPTLAEGNKNLAGVWRKAHSFPILLKGLDYFHKYRR